MNDKIARANKGDPKAKRIQNQHFKSLMGSDNLSLA